MGEASPRRSSSTSPSWLHIAELDEHDSDGRAVLRGPQQKASRRANVRVDVMDGRHFLKMSHDTYDVIMSDSMILASEGSLRLYTQEHFREARRHLNPGGVVLAWLPLERRPTRRWSSEDVPGGLPAEPAVAAAGPQHAGGLPHRLPGRGAHRLGGVAGRSSSGWPRRTWRAWLGRPGRLLRELPGGPRAAGGDRLARAAHQPGHEPGARLPPAGAAQGDRRRRRAARRVRAGLHLRAPARAPRSPGVTGVAARQRPAGTRGGSALPEGGGGTRRVRRAASGGGAEERGVPHRPASARR